jgi:hypothetical protein
MTYNDTFLSNQSNFLEIIRGVNEATSPSYLFGMVLLVLIFLVIFIALKSYDTKVAFLVSSFSTTIIGIVMLAAELIIFERLVYFIILLVASIIVYFVTD